MIILRKNKHTIMVMLVALIVTSITVSCEKAENTHSSYTAYFRYNPVSAIPNLFRACTSLGEFCSITYPLGAKSLVVKSPSVSTTDLISLTALQGYQGFILGVGGGLIIGLPMIPEMLQNESRVVCYDLCCPNCYHNDNICKQMTLNADGTSSCSKCQRNYDLNNQGIIVEGEAGKSLFRYYVNYYPPTQTLTVDNK